MHCLAHCVEPSLVLPRVFYCLASRFSHDESSPLVHRRTMACRIHHRKRCNRNLDVQYTSRYIPVYFLHRHQFDVGTSLGILSRSARPADPRRSPTPASRKPKSPRPTLRLSIESTRTYSQHYSFVPFGTTKPYKQFVCILTYSIQ